MSAPTTVGSSQVIVYTTQTGSNPPVSTNVPDWYPNSGAATPVQTAKTTDQGSVAISPTCSLSASIATTAEDLHTDSTRITPYSLANALGSYNVTSTDRYMAPGIGLVCSVTTSTTNNYNATTDGSLATTTQVVTIVRMIGGGFGPLVKMAGGASVSPGFMGVRP